MNITRRGLIAAAAAAAVLPTVRSTKAAGGEVIIATCVYRKFDSA